MSDMTDKVEGGTLMQSEIDKYRGEEKKNAMEVEKGKNDYAKQFTEFIKKDIDKAREKAEKEKEKSRKKKEKKPNAIGNFFKRLVNVLS